MKFKKLLYIMLLSSTFVFGAASHELDEELEKIRNCENLKVYYNCLKADLNSFGVACFALNSGMVGRGHYEGKTFVDLISLVGQLVPLEQASMATGVLKYGLEAYLTGKESKREKSIVESCTSLTEYEHRVEFLAKLFTLSYQEPLQNLYGENEARKLAHFMSYKMIKYFKHINDLAKVDHEKHQDANIVTVLSLPSHSAGSRLKEKVKKGKRFLKELIFRKTYLKVINKSSNSATYIKMDPAVFLDTVGLKVGSKYYSHDGLPTACGYRVGLVQEFNILGMYPISEDAMLQASLVETTVNPLSYDGIANKPEVYPSVVIIKPSKSHGCYY